MAEQYSIDQPRNPHPTPRPEGRGSPWRVIRTKYGQSTDKLPGEALEWAADPDKVRTIYGQAPPGRAARSGLFGASCGPGSAGGGPFWFVVGRARRRAGQCLPIIHDPRSQVPMIQQPLIQNRD